MIKKREKTILEKAREAYQNNPPKPGMSLDFIASRVPPPVSEEDQRGKTGPDPLELMRQGIKINKTVLPFLARKGTIDYQLFKSIVKKEDKTR